MHPAGQSTSAMIVCEIRWDEMVVIIKKPNEGLPQQNLDKDLIQKPKFK